MPIMEYEDALDMIAASRDQHLKQAAEWHCLMEKYANSGNRQMTSEASGMIERNNFAAQSLSQLLARAEARNRH